MARNLVRVSPLIQCFRAPSSFSFPSMIWKNCKIYDLTLKVCEWQKFGQTDDTTKNKIRNFNGLWQNLCEWGQKWFKWGMDSVLRRARKGTQYSITWAISTTFREKSWEVKNISSSQVYTIFNRKNLHTVNSRVLLLFGQSNKRFWTHSTLKGLIPCMNP